MQRSSIACADRGPWAIPHPQLIANFWSVVGALSPEKQRKLLFLVTGCSGTPAGGFDRLQPQPFTLYITPDPARLPVAHTCLNQLDLPNCEDKAVMCEKIRYFLAQDGQFALS